MIHAAELGTVRISRKNDLVRIQEVYEPSVMGRIFGGLGALAFAGVSLLFWQMPIENEDSTTFILRIVLCGGLLAIGILLGRSALIPRDTVMRLEFDVGEQEMRVVNVNQEGERDIKHAVGFAAIKRFYAGSQADHSIHNRGGSTVLYMEGEGGPRNGALIVGSVRELESFVQEANELITRAPSAPRATTASSPASAGGFGRKGIA